MCSFKICIREKRADDSERAERKNPGIYALLNETMLLFTLPINFYPLICFSQYALFLLVIWYARNRFNKSLYIIEMFVENLRLILQLQKQSLHKIIRQFFFCSWIALFFQYSQNPKTNSSMNEIFFSLKISENLHLLHFKIG